MQMFSEENVFDGSGINIGIEYHSHGLRLLILHELFN